MRSAGHTVLENDIVDYGQGQDRVQDFLNFKPAQAGEIDAIVTNPPFRLGAAFRSARAISVPAPVHAAEVELP